MSSNAAPLAPSHPLPAGMRDLLPRDAAERHALTERLYAEVALAGYELVTPPAFEFADVLERGLGALDASDVLRFVEPESGEVAALRPDMTPQIARIIATRLAAGPRPIRLFYEGTVVRRKQGRARRARQIAQAGVELAGLGAPKGDLEMLELAAGAVRAAGLVRFVVDIGHARIGRTLLDALPPAKVRPVAEALERKDGAGVEALLADALSVPEPVRRALLELSELEGDAHQASDLLKRGRKLLAATPARAALDDLALLFEAASVLPGLEGSLRLDLGAVRHLAYYTGLIFQVFAPGAGEAIGAGGRYDDLLERFGAPMPAVGCAFSLDALARAREAAGLVEPVRAIVLVALGDASAPFVRALRARGVAAVDADSTLAAAAIERARQGRFSHAMTSNAGQIQAIGVHSGDAIELGNDPAAAASAFVGRCLGVKESG